MDDTIAKHLAATPLTTLGLFSVTHTGKGKINPGLKGAVKIAGDLGGQLIREAHDRGTRVELVYTSFGAAKNRRLFEDPALQAKVVASLVTLVGELGVDGVNVDIEGLDPGLVPAYGSFVGNLRTALIAADAGDRVTVSTGSGALGAGMALAAVAAGADRVFLMGYDYRVGRSAPGASSPLVNRDGSGSPSLTRSLDIYAALGVPVEKTLLGLPLYGVEWPVDSPVLAAPATDRGAAWILRKHVDLLGDASVVPLRDQTEVVEVYISGPDGPLRSDAPPDPAASPGSAGASAPASASPDMDEGPWRAVYVDSPATLERKLGLVDERGLAGAGFWAIGYERGLPGYTRMMRAFAESAPTP
jgi:spore germination protein YaaH